MAFDTPILFIIFNRPTETKIVFESIRRIAPAKLYIAADGPRQSRPSDQEKCAETRSVVSMVDWPCKVSTIMSENNMGCGKAVSEAISWFFDHEEQGIILEDDCVATDSFFRFCEELLKKFKYDTRIMHIGGTNHNPAFCRDPEYSYFFSQVGHMWGWATWRRAWALYDITMKIFPEISEKGYFKDLYPNAFVRKYSTNNFLKTYKKKLDTWDYQWEFTRLINSGLSIVPKYNLVENIGFGPDATHTFSNKNYFDLAHTKELSFPLSHPPFIIKDTKSENKHYNKLLKWIVKRKILAKIGLKGYDFKG